MDQTPMQQGEILLYNNDGEKEFVSVVFRDETFWLTQKAMAELFDVNVPAISKHLQNIYEEEELTRDATVSKMETSSRRRVPGGFAASWSTTTWMPSSPWATG